MVLPIVIGLAGITALGVGRAAYRAYTRLNAIPMHMFVAAVSGDHTLKKEANFLLGGFEDKMTYSEALSILDLPPGADKKEISTQHRKVMLANHPDRGGSNYFASKINEAKDVLNKH